MQATSGVMLSVMPEVAYIMKNINYNHNFKLPMLDKTLKRVYGRERKIIIYNIKRYI